MKHWLSAALFIFSIGLFGQTTLSKPILLWPDGAPGTTGNSDEDKPAIIPFIPEASEQNGTAMLVIPGGGFTIRAVDHEGVLVCQWLKERGITAFLLRYRLRPLYERKDWLLDGQRAMQYIRANASRYQLDVDRIGAVGFSAGANLVADLGFNGSPGMSDASDPLEKQSAIPSFNVLAYGSMAFPSDLPADRIKTIPPTFMYSTTEDAGSIYGMSSLYSDLMRHKVPVESHFFQNGVHGTGFAVGDPVLGQWTQMLWNWMHTNGFLSGKPRMPISGVVKLDGSPLLRGLIVLTPVEDANDPPVIIYMTNTGTGELGRFDMPENQGPVKGKYKVEVRQEATRWTSNSRDPFMIEMMAKYRQQTLTDEDRKKWGEFLRRRDLSPSIDNSILFAKQHPGDKRDYIIDVADGKDVLIEVFSK